MAAFYTTALADVWAEAQDDACEAYYASTSPLTHPDDKADYAADCDFHLKVAAVADQAAKLISEAFGS